MPFSNPITISLAAAKSYVTHGPYIESPLAWAIGKITSSKKIRWERWTFDISSVASAGNHVGWLKLGAALPGHTLDGNLAVLAEARETITISVAFNATHCEDLYVQLQP
ncbi:MAG TPA: hypothetical protein VK509_12070 [Polyangiales bacterium]|nr:hypothetical protein [Polyangiales bacterium]